MCGVRGEERCVELVVEGVAVVVGVVGSCRFEGVRGCGEGERVACTERRSEDWCGHLLVGGMEDGFGGD